MWTRTVNLDEVGQEEQELLLQELYKHMFIVAYSIMRNRSEAMDVVQESWLKILMKLDTLRDQDKIIQWAKVIASNTAYNMIKRSSKYIERIKEECMMYETAAATSEVEEFIDQKIVWESVMSLDNTTRQIFVYKYYQDLKDQDIAEKMGMPVGTIKARLHRGKEQLRNMLKEPTVKTDHF
ncbi:MAG: DNA-directed polymerase sigma-70 factor [Paenibacillus sp.]|nr:DNA-directed polymerase sigma-70 factor [Paenibacillus sp.]